MIQNAADIIIGLLVLIVILIAWYGHRIKTRLDIMIRQRGGEPPR